MVRFYSLPIFLSRYCWKPIIKVTVLKLDSFHDISKTRLPNFSPVQEKFFSSKHIFIRSLTFSLVYLISKIIAVYQNSSGLVFCQHFFLYKSNTPIFCDYSSHLFCERVPCVAAIVLMLSAFFFRENFINSSFSHPNSWGPYIFIVATWKKMHWMVKITKSPSSIPLQPPSYVLVLNLASFMFRRRPLLTKKHKLTKSLHISIIQLENHYFQQELLLIYYTLYNHVFI